MAEKIIRDPVHDVIAFEMTQPLDALLFRLLNAAEFQRLRRIRQLGLASLAYPGADHSRYSHSLGVMETARKMLNQLRRSVTIDPAMETLCLTGALLHDLGHGPFSHLFERTSGIEHEQVTLRMIEDPQTDVHALLKEYDPQLPARLVDFLACRPQRSFYNDILASTLDADRFDYLLRDNLMTGSQYGGYDLTWLLHALAVDPASDRLAVTWKGISAIEDYLSARYHMYRNVYFHKVVRSAEGMVRLALQRASRLAVQERLPWPPREHVIHKALLGQTLTPADFTWLDDFSMLECFKAWSDGDDWMLSNLCRGLLFRRLHKVIDLSRVDDPGLLQRICRESAALITRDGGDPEAELFLDEPSDTPYESFRPDGTCSGDGEIQVLDVQGQLTPFSQLSPLVGALNQQLRFRRLHVAETHRDSVRQRVTDILAAHKQG